MPTEPRSAMTLEDALNLAFAIQRVNVNSDRGRLQRGYALAAAALQSFGAYQIAAYGKTFETRRCHYAVAKFDTVTGHQLDRYVINLKRELACSCPDSQDNGQINCKHVLGVVLWQMAHDLYTQYVRETV